MANMDAELVADDKRELPGGFIQQMVIWRVPSPVLGSTHSFKYRLYFGRSRQRLVGYDNERGKGDHRHLAGRELPYRFVDTLNSDR